VTPLTGNESNPLRDLPLSDEEVVDRVIAGDKFLYEVLMRRYNQRLFRIARAMVREDDEAEDVMQDAYVRAYASLDQFARRAKFSTWLTKIVVHEASRRVRKRSRISELSPKGDEDRNDMEIVRGSGPDPEQQTLTGEASSLLEQAIDSLPARYRSVFVLREVEIMSVAETAACLDLSEEAVKVRLMRARDKLRHALYERVGATNSQAFQFLGWRCDGMVKRVLERI
jgi:RNA polymerase sigma-70 factor (ECF subfamily)